MINVCECGCGGKAAPKKRFAKGHYLNRRANTIMGIMGRLVVQENGCAVWPGLKTRKGYGSVCYQMRTRRVHDVMYRHFVGEVPDGLVLHHAVCDNPACANFAHLRPVTIAQNVLRGNGPSAQNARKTHCSRGGHPLSGDNVYVDRKGKRSCKACQRPQRLTTPKEEN